MMLSHQVNAISFHPVHGTLATVGSDGRFSFWDKDARTKLKTSEQLDQPITACCFNSNGNIFAYASSYDWSKVGANYLQIWLACVCISLQYFQAVAFTSCWNPHVNIVLSCEFFRAMSTTTPRKRTTSSWGVLPRSWSPGTRNGERSAAAVCKHGGALAPPRSLARPNMATGNRHESVLRAWCCAHLREVLSKAFGQGSLLVVMPILYTYL